MNDKMQIMLEFIDKAGISVKGMKARFDDKKYTMSF